MHGIINMKFYYVLIMVVIAACYQNAPAHTLKMHNMIGYRSSTDDRINICCTTAHSFHQELQYKPIKSKVVYKKSKYASVKVLVTT